MSGINAIKRDLFFHLMETAGRVYIHVRPSENVLLGRRGFINEEKDQGITLVINPKMKYTWEGDVLEAVLSFNRMAEKCLIPANEIDLVYSPELNVQLMAQTDDDDDEADDAPAEADKVVHGKVIQVDFKRK